MRPGVGALARGGPAGSTIAGGGGGGGGVRTERPQEIAAQDFAQRRFF
jgi:hypothetical protein